MVKLSLHQKQDYLHRARDVTAGFNDAGSFRDELGHTLSTYRTMSALAREAVLHVISELPLRDPDALLNAFVGRQLLIETEEVLFARVDQESDLLISLWDDGADPDPAFDSEIARKARREDLRRRREWNIGEIASDEDIAASAQDGADIGRLFKDPPRPRVVRPEPPTLLLAEGITTNCRNAMTPLIRSFLCRNSVRTVMHQRIEAIRRMALQLAVLSDEDEFQMI
ncbi:MAG TPA: hypothetical protein PKV72_06880 [Candidatus Peribacteria bacterium]|nr:hypothetical protein [Candidatus Peribacteria bacterium]